MNRLLFNFAVAIALTSSACSVRLVSSRTPAGAAASIYNISVSSGNSQSVTVATATGSALVAVVRDSSGNPVSGVTVNWAVTSGAGSLSSSSNITNASGLSSTTPTLGTVAGSNTFTATINGTSTSVLFSATGTAALPVSISVSAGNSQSAIAGAAAGSPFEAVVRDTYGNPVSGVTVNWAVTGGGGSLSSASNSTNASGISMSTLTLGTLVGSNTVSATINATATSTSFSATGTPGAPATISVSSGNAQTGTAGSALSSSFVAVVRDANTNLVPGVTINWAVTAGGGSLSSASNSTNASGQSASTLTLGTTAGSNTVTATINATAISTAFSATGNPGAPASISKASGDAQNGATSNALTNPFVAVVRDANNNVISGVTVNWAVTAGGGSLSSASNATDVAGQSTSTLTLGSSTGSNTVTATINATAISTTFTANAEVPFTLSNDTGMVQRNASSTTLTVLANDVNNLSLSFTVTSVTQPANGTVTNGTTNVTYQPNASYTGRDTFTYTVTDSQGHTDTATVTMKVMGTHTWTGATSNTWDNSTASNWCGTVTTPGLSGACAGAGAVPGASDTAIIDDTCSSANCSPTTNYNVSVSALNIAGSQLNQGTGFTLTVGSGGYAQSAGTFMGSNADITMNGTLTTTGGTFRSTSSKLIAKTHVTLGTTQANFNANGGTFQISGGLTQNIDTGNVNLNHLEIVKTNWQINFTGTVMNVLGDVILTTMTSGVGFGGSAIINLSGNLTATAGCTGNSNGAGATIKLVGSSNQTITGSSGCHFPHVQVASTGGQVILVGTVQIGGNWTYTTGTMNVGTSLVQFSGSNNQAVDAAGMNFGNVRFGKPNWYLNITGIMHIDGDLTYDFSAAAVTMNGVVYLKGNLTAGASCNNAGTGGGTIRLVGTAQTITGTSTCSIPVIEIASGGTVALSGTILAEGNWTYISGAVSAGTSTVQFSAYNNQTITATGMSFNDVILRKNTWNHLISGTMNIAGNLLIDNNTGAGVTVGGGGTISLAGNLTMNGNWGGNAAMTFVGTGSQTITFNGGTFITGTITDSNTGAGISLATAATFHNLSVTTGTFYMANQNMTISTTLTLSPSTVVDRGTGTLTVNGSTIGAGAYSGGSVL